tara:strand:- start:82 stop:384 length:303 start_codon:yes stop_codon:yes gene_type:complete
MAKFLKLNVIQSGKGERDLLIGLNNLTAIENISGGITLTYGSSSNTKDVLRLFFNTTDQTYPQQMSNFFQDKMIQAQNANSTSPVLNMISPIKITHYTLS